MTSRFAWDFTDQVSSTRRERLNAAPSFGSIVQRILSEMQIVKFVVRKGELGHVKCCKRPEFTVKVSEDTFDMFFNSKNGYRAQFLRGVEIGKRANAKIVQAIAGHLIRYARENPAKLSMALESIRVSLRSQSAKVWIDENGRRKAKASDLTKLNADLNVQPWHRIAKSCFDDRNLFSTEKSKAIDGVKAPLGTRLEVKGAFLDINGQEFIPEDKIDRDQQIHDFGFS